MQWRHHHFHRAKKVGGERTNRRLSAGAARAAGPVARRLPRLRCPQHVFHAQPLPPRSRDATTNFSSTCNTSEPGGISSMSRLSPAVPGEEGRYGASPSYRRHDTDPRVVLEPPQKRWTLCLRAAPSAALGSCPKWAHGATEQLLNSWQSYSSFFCVRLVSEHLTKRC